MAFSRCGSYHKNTCYYDEYIAIQDELNKLKGRLTVDLLHSSLFSLHFP